MIALRRAGRSLRQIGRIFNLTGERVRQLLVDHVPSTEAHRIGVDQARLMGPLRQQLTDLFLQGRTFPSIGQLLIVTPSAAYLAVHKLGLTRPNIQQGQRRWSLEAIRAAAEGAGSVAEMARRLGVSSHCMYSYAKRPGYTELPAILKAIRRHPGALDIKIPWSVDLLDLRRTLTCHEIAVRFGCSTGSVYKRLQILQTKQHLQGGGDDAVT